MIRPRMQNLNIRGASHHLILPVIAILLAAGIGMYVRQSSIAATDCSMVVIKYKSRGECVKQAQSRLVTLGYLSNTNNTAVDGIYGVGTTNAVLNFQRAMGLRSPNDDGIVGPVTWGLLKAPRTVSTKLDSRCLIGKLVFCASQSQRKLFFIKDGVVKKTLSARFGGMAWDPKLNGGAGGYRVHRTGLGTYYVYARVNNPISKTYGENSMPYSFMFDKNMYIHYSADFASRGYLGASHGCINIRDKTSLAAIYNDTAIKSAVKLFPDSTPSTTIFQPVNKSSVKVVIY